MLAVTPTPLAMCAYTLTSMPRSPATIAREARLAAGLTVRAIAAQAGVAATTITRIESGRIDPTVGTLRSILRAAGRELRLDAPTAASIHIADLTTAWRRHGDEDRPDWTALRAAIDHLTLHPEETADAIEAAPAASGSQIVDVLLAGIADKLADDHHIARPEWTYAAPVLDRDTFLMPTTPRQRRTIRDTTPGQLAARRLYVDAATLWRPPVPSDA